MNARGNLLFVERRIVPIGTVPPVRQTGGV